LEPYVFFSYPRAPTSARYFNSEFPVRRIVQDELAAADERLLDVSAGDPKEHGAKARPTGASGVALVASLRSGAPTGSERLDVNTRRRARSRRCRTTPSRRRCPAAFQTAGRIR